MTTDVFDALEAEEDRLGLILGGLNEAQWAAPSGCEGWSVQDVVLHLAQTEEAVVASLEGRVPPFPVGEGASTIDEVVDRWVVSERGSSGPEVHSRWDVARRSAVEGLRAAEPDRSVAWAAAPLKPRTLATTRLSEHWIHTLDIADPLGIAHPDNDNLRHIAWLAIKTIGYAFTREGRDDAPVVRAELEAPNGERWVLGPEDAQCVITGPAGEFCRVAARRLSAERAENLHSTGERAGEVLQLVRTYA